ncbi:hypothetical protein [Actinomadura sp. NPDC049753]|uniref:hypothetical protein n=1 Tax=Actinomadura sp. NPDC049753 TaxID=3154739 RepID=UPI003449B05C
MIDADETADDPGLTCPAAMACGRVVHLDGTRSSEQLSGWLRRSFPDDLALQISHEAI